MKLWMEVSYLGVLILGGVWFFRFWEERIFDSKGFEGIVFFFGLLLN